MTDTYGNILHNDLPSSPQSDREFHIPFASRAIFWQPRYVAVSDSLVHVPYLFWLMEAARPRGVAQIGLSDGVSFLALCQAIDKLNLASICIGIRPNAESVSQSYEYEQQHSTHYTDFSLIADENVGRSARHLRDVGVDLLMLNTALSDELVMALRADWQPLLTNNAVVALQRPECEAIGQDTRAFLDELGRYPSIRIDHGDNWLETYLIGKDQPERLSKVAEIGTNSTSNRAACQVFVRLGQGIRMTQQAEAKEQELKVLDARLRENQAQLDQTNMQLTVARNEKHQTELAEVDFAKLIATLQAKLFDVEKDLEAERDRASKAEGLRADLEVAQKERDELQAKLFDVEKDLETQKYESAGEIERLRGRLEKSYDGIRVLTEKLEIHVSQLAKARAKADTYEQLHSKLRRSSSWRITAPLREIGRGWRKLGRRIRGKGVG